MGSFLTISFALIILLSLSKIIEQMDNNSHLGKSMSDNPSVYASNADVLILGDSRANQGIDSHIVEQTLEHKFGKNLKVYNLGRPGLQTPFAYFLLADYLKKSSMKPKVVVVNFSFYMLGGMDWMNDIYFSYYKPELWQVLDAIDSKLITVSQGISWYFTTRIPFLRYKKRFKTGILESISGDTNQIYKSFCWSSFFEDFVISGRTKGYLSNGAICVPPETLNLESYSDYVNTIHNGYSVYFEYLKKFSDLAAKNNINVVIYQFPWPKIAKDNPYFQEQILNYYEDLLKETVRDNPYIHFVDYDYYWEHNLFIDPLHLNQIGANKLSSQYAPDWIMEHIDYLPTN